MVSIVTTHLTVAHATNDHDIPSARPKQMKQVLELADLFASVTAPPLSETNSAKDDNAAAAGATHEAGAAAAVCFVAGDLNCDHLETEPPNDVYTAHDVAKPVHMAFAAGFQSSFHDALSKTQPATVAGGSGGSGGSGRSGSSSSGGGSTGAGGGSSARPISHTCSYAQDGCCDYILSRRGSSGDGGGGGGAVKVSRSYLWPECVPCDTEWNATTGWGSSLLLSDHRPLVTDFTLSPQ